MFRFLSQTQTNISSYHLFYSTNSPGIVELILFIKSPTSDAQGACAARSPVHSY